MGLSKHVSSFAGIILLLGGFNGDQASMASTAVHVADNHLGVSLIEAGVYRSINGVMSNSVKSVANQTANAGSGFINSSFSSELGFKQGGNETAGAGPAANAQALLTTHVAAVPLPAWIWLLLTAFIAFLGLTRPKSTMKA